MCRPDARVLRGGSRAARRLIASLLVVAGASSAAHAQAGGVLVQGIVDGEAWFTSGTSNLLTRNGGKPAELGRVTLWGAYQPFGDLVLYAETREEFGTALPPAYRSDFDVEQFGARYIVAKSFVADVGRLAPVVGAFAPRQLSTRNPLIGTPDGYSLEYPYGAKISGETEHFDYRVALISLPSYHTGYVPVPTQRLRPAVGAGFTPMAGLHFGVSYTQGPYLNDLLTPAQLAGREWTSYGQRVIGLDAAYAVGYLETHAEYSRGSYDLPGRTADVSGTAYYGEAKYTFTPRFFAAFRAERNDYPFIRALTSTWIGKLTDFEDAEIGLGYRVTASTLVKASFRADRWWIAPNAAGFLGQGGSAFAMQVSQAFDVLGWFQRKQ